MSTKKELEEQVTKHSKVMSEVFKNIRLLKKEEEFKEFYKLALSYFNDSKHFHSKGLLVQAFEALIISWAYLDTGLRLDIFELTDEKLSDYFTT
jgi:hypothetical protein